MPATVTKWRIPKKAIEKDIPAHCQVIFNCLFEVFVACEAEDAGCVGRVGEWRLRRERERTNSLETLARSSTSRKENSRQTQFKRDNHLEAGYKRADASQTRHGFHMKENAARLETAEYSEE